MSIRWLDTGPSRIHVTAVAACAALLLVQSLGGSAPGPTSGPAASSRPSLDASTIATALERVNPGLSPQERARIGAAVVRSSQRHGLDPELVTAVLLVESGARPWATSPKGAIGLMQVMPHMMEPLGLAGNVATIESNIEAGCQILADNIRRLGEDEGISTYFWGSKVRGVAYLRKVRRAQETLRSLVAS
jgi:hypothetical protein